MSTKNRLVALIFFTSLALGSQAGDPIPETAVPKVIVNTSAEPMAPGKFQPTWESLKQYQVPDWFRNAKFGIWAHWGPQCQPEASDWYARNMYVRGHAQNAYQVAHYGPPSQAGFKEVIHSWQAEKFDPEKLVALYKRTGAQYFVALGNHHDNFDLWDSKYQPWNSVRVGPRKDLIAGWAKAAHDQGLPFGVSLHASHAWSWYEVTQGADKTGPLAGMPYDGKLTKADGLGKWWDGLDPQDLYEQRHTPSPDFEKPGSIHDRWDWNNGVSRQLAIETSVDWTLQGSLPTWLAVNKTSGSGSDTLVFTTLKQNITSIRRDAVFYLFSPKAEMVTFSVFQKGKAETTGGEDACFGKIYPNPASGYANIEFKPPLPKACRLKVFNSSGILIKSDEYPAGLAKGTFDISGFPEGLYFVQLIGGDFQTMNKLVVTK